MAELTKEYGKVPQVQTPEASKKSRHTENKRRYRARQKEYVSDLEARLAEVREQGIQSTREVQLAARQVVVQNQRLRQLLQIAGFTNEEIDFWQASGGDGNCVNPTSHCSRRQAIERKARQRAASSACENLGCGPRASSSSADASNISSEAIQIGPPFETSKSPQEHDPGLQNHADPTQGTATGQASATSEVPVIAPAENRPQCAEQMRPCLLLTRVGRNPGANITQIPTGPGPTDCAQDSDGASGGVECKKAYEMLMTFATSEEKMDHIARALERGCTANGKGGCAVKAEVVWQTLDGMC